MAIGQEQLDADIAALMAQDQANASPANQQTEPEGTAAQAAPAPTPPPESGAIQQQAQTDDAAPAAVDEQSPATVPIEDYKRLQDRLAGTKGQFEQQLRDMKAQLERLTLENQVKALSQQGAAPQQQQAIQEAQESFQELIDSLGTEEAAKPFIKQFKSLQSEIKAIREQSARQAAPDIGAIEAKLGREMYLRDLGKEIPGYEKMAASSEFKEFLDTNREYGRPLLDNLVDSINGRDTDSVRKVVSRYADFMRRTGQAASLPNEFKKSNTAPGPDKANGLESRISPQRSTARATQPQPAPEGYTDGQIEAALDILNSNGRGKTYSAEELKEARMIEAYAIAKFRAAR